MRGLQYLANILQITQQRLRVQQISCVSSLTRPQVLQILRFVADALCCEHPPDGVGHINIENETHAL